VNPSGIRQLIAIVDGRLPTPRRRWYTLYLRISYAATLDDQLDAIRKLGGSMNPHVLSHLQDIAKEDTNSVGWRTPGAIHGTSCRRYPRANGPLKAALECTETDEYDYTAGPAVPQVTKHRRREEARGVLDEAIARLRAQLTTSCA
jgi:hypothetical protein